MVRRPKPGSDDGATTLTAGRRRAFVRQFHLLVLDGPDRGRELRSSGERAVIGTHEAADLVLSDPTVSRFHCEISLVDNVATLRDLGSRNGTRVDEVSIVEARLNGPTTMVLGHSRVRFTLGDELEIGLSDRERFGRLVGTSAASRRMFDLLERAAASDVNVLLQGETGVGKEMAAESIHLESSRRDRPFLVVDCGALPEPLAESELFGHRAGAFSGATTDRVGAFQAATGGTLLLDEIGELPLAVQPKLLRAIERREVKPIGENRHSLVDVRVISATHRDLRADVNAHRFRSDLYYRVAVLPISIPPLRERVEDIPLLVDGLLDELGHGSSPAAARLRTRAFVTELSQQPWRGNVRELRNYLEACLTMDSSPATAPSDLPAEAAAVGFRAARAAWEKAYVTRLMRDHGDNVSAAARAAGLDRMSFYRMLWRAGLKAPP